MLISTGEKGDKLANLKSLIAEVLQIPEMEVTEGLEYRSISEWDSLGHVNLMLALEEAYDINIDIDFRTKLTSVASIQTFMEKNSNGQNEVNKHIEINKMDEHSNGNEFIDSENSIAVHRGLANIVFDETKITSIDGKAGELTYRGFSIDDLVQYSNFEEVIYLLLYGKLPNKVEYKLFSDRLRSSGHIPEPIFVIIKELKNARPIEMLRTVISALAVFDSKRNINSKDIFEERIIRLISQIPTIIATHNAIRNGKEIMKPNKNLSYIENILYMLCGEKTPKNYSNIMNKIFILHADHSSNASAFTARVTTSTRSDIYAALTAAIATFEGALHGGAIENVLSMLYEIGTPANATTYISERIKKNQPIMGFGHRVYQISDPRARQLHKIANELSLEKNNEYLWEVAQSVVEAMQPYIQKGVDVNVDFYSSIIYHLLGLPQDIFIAIFAAARIPGWIAQIQEQMENNILIRPLLRYTGEENQSFIQINKR